MTYAQASRLLARRQETRWKLGLSRIRGLLSALGDPHLGLRCVHVAGTNGKGSVCAMLASILSAAGLRAGLYTSPHLCAPTERIRIDGRPVSKAEFGALVGEAVRAEQEEATYFELVTAAAFLHFKHRADIVVLETGLGGRLDATNAVEDPLLTILTSISIDHVGHLGDTLASIAREKAGIIKPGRPCLAAEAPGEALGVIRERARELGSPLFVRVPEWRRLGSRWDEGAQDLEFGGRGLSVGLLGDAAASNAALALEAAALLRAEGLAIPPAAEERGLSGVDWPARFQVLHPEAGGALIIDGAHNLAAMEAFAATWKSSPWGAKPARFVVGMLEDKDFEGMLRLLAPLAAGVIATRPDSPRALEPRVLAGRLRAAGVDDVLIEADPRAALRRWLDSDARAGAVVGSFYLAGSALSELSLHGAGL